MTGRRGGNIHTHWRRVEARSNETVCVSLVPAWHVVVMVGELVHVISGLGVYPVFGLHLLGGLESLTASAVVGRLAEFCLQHLFLKVRIVFL